MDRIPRIALLLVFLSGCSIEEPAGRNQNDTRSVEHDMGIIEAGNWVSKDSSNVTTIGSLLDELSSTFHVSRTTIGNQTLKAQELLKERGISESTVSIMRSIKGSRSVGDLNISYAEYCAAYLALRKGG